MAALDNLDGATVAAAFGLQLLRTAYSGPLIKIRRSTDNATQDINPDGSGNLDTAAITTFIGANSAFIDTWYDQSGNARHATASATGRQPRIVNAGALEVIGSAPAMLPDGTDDCLFTASFNLSAFTQATIVALTTHTTTSSGTKVIAEHGSAIAAGGGFGTYMNASGASIASSGVGNSSRYLFAGVSDSSSSLVFTSRINSASPYNAGRVESRISGEVLPWTRTAALSTVTSGDGFQSSNPLYLMARTNSGSYNNHPVGGVVLFAGSVSETVVRQVESAFTTAAGITYGGASALTWGDTPTDWDYATAHTESATPVFIKTPPLTEVEYQTSATELKIHAHNDTFGVTAVELGIWKDNVWEALIAPGSSGATSHTVSLSSGTKKIRITSGPQVSSSRLGTWLRCLSANEQLTRTTRTETGGIVFYGDSIITGYNGTTRVRNGVTGLLRNLTSTPVALESYGSRTLNEDTSSAGVQTALVTRLAALAPTKVWLAIGTNDYGLNVINAATFETRYASLLVELNAALPSATIYAQTPLLRTTETANGLGSTLANYRTAISNAASGKAYVTVVDGTAIMTTGDLADGLHPNDAGHELYADAIMSEAGLPSSSGGGGSAANLLLMGVG